MRTTSFTGSTSVKPLVFAPAQLLGDVPLDRTRRLGGVGELQRAARESGRPLGAFDDLRWCQSGWRKRPKLTDSLSDGMVFG